MTLSTQERLDELDRNMDAVFADLYVVRSTLAAVIPVLSAQQAAQVLPKLDEALDSLLTDTPNPTMAVLTLNTWRNQLAKNAAQPERQL